MKRLVKHIRIKFISYLLLAGFILFLFNNVIFFHSHILPNGEIITHAHPFSKKTDSQPFKSHHHSKEDLVFIQNLQLLFAVSFVLFSILKIFYKKEKNLSFKNSIYRFNYLFYLRNRAPPFNIN
ncbi:MAG: hypothetical protein U9R42_02300 [Bacteroidota bacterium]|nr:hypothetical protein [Bacteroidota bacterium]